MRNQRSQKLLFQNWHSSRSLSKHAWLLCCMFILQWKEEIFCNDIWYFAIWFKWRVDIFSSLRCLNPETKKEYILSIGTLWRACTSLYVGTNVLFPLLTQKNVTADTNLQTFMNLLEECLVNKAPISFSKLKHFWTHWADRWFMSCFSLLLVNEKRSLCLYWKAMYNCNFNP